MLAVNLSPPLALLGSIVRTEKRSLHIFRKCQIHRVRLEKLKTAVYALRGDADGSNGYSLFSDSA